MSQPSISLSSLISAWSHADQSRSELEQMISSLLPPEGDARVEALDQLIAEAGGRNTVLGAAFECYAVRERVVARRLNARRTSSKSAVRMTVITIGTDINGEPGVDIGGYMGESFRADTMDHLDSYTHRSSEEKQTFRAWLFADERRPGDHWTVVDEYGDNVASVVLA